MVENLGHFQMAPVGQENQSARTSDSSPVFQGRVLEDGHAANVIPQGLRAV
ncbi:hypothetical protein ACFL2Q_09950 [Thermodesulfobacteriota bacterium]